MGSVSEAEVAAALTAVRERAESHMDQSDAAGLPWGEEAVTEGVWLAGMPTFQVVPFGRRQERAVGADWLWWVLGPGEECFGMLVQAKRLRRRGSGPWRLDVGYRGGEQAERLQDTADALSVPAVYALYLGGTVLRSGSPSRHDTPHLVTRGCLRCREQSVSMLPAVVARSEDSPRECAEIALEHAIPLEDLGRTRRYPSGAWLAGALAVTGTPLGEWLMRPEAGPQAVARAITEATVTRRAAQFARVEERVVELPVAQAPIDTVDVETFPDDATLEDLAADGSPPVFTGVPRDTGHMDGPYLLEMLSGLRQSQPTYVRDILTGLPVPHALQAAVDGVVLVHF